MAKHRMPLDIDKADEISAEEVIEEIKEEVKKESKPVRYSSVIGCEQLRLRKEPSTSADVLTYIPKDAQVVFKGKKDADWARVEYNDIEGFVMSKFLERN